VRRSQAGNVWSDAVKRALEQPAEGEVLVGGVVDQVETAERVEDDPGAEVDQVVHPVVDVGELVAELAAVLDLDLRGDLDGLGDVGVIADRRAFDRIRAVGFEADAGTAPAVDRLPLCRNGRGRRGERSSQYCRYPEPFHAGLPNCSRDIIGIRPIGQAGTMKWPRQHRPARSFPGKPSRMFRCPAHLPPGETGRLQSLTWR